MNKQTNERMNEDKRKEMEGYGCVRAHVQQEINRQSTERSRTLETLCAQVALCVCKTKTKNICEGGIGGVGQGGRTRTERRRHENGETTNQYDAGSHEPLTARAACGRAGREGQ